MLVVFKVAGTLTKGWRMSRSRQLPRHTPAASSASQQQLPLTPAPRGCRDVDFGSDVSAARSRASKR